MPKINRTEGNCVERRFYLANELETADITPPSYILDPLIPRGRLIMGVGDSTQGKTPFGLQLTRDLAGGLDFLDCYKNCGEEIRVALVDAESPKEDVSLRLKMQREGRAAETGENLIVLDVDTVLDCHFDLTPKGIERIGEFVKEENISFLMLDNLWALAGGQDISKGYVAQPILHGLRAITRLPHSPSIGFFHHPRKGADNLHLPDLATMDFARWAEEASGSRIFFNLTDVRFGLQRCERKGEQYTIFRGRSRVPGSQQDFGPLYLTIDEDHSLALIDRRPSVIQLMGNKEQEVLNAMFHFEQFDVKDAKRETAGNVGDKTIRRALQHACEHGILVRVQPAVFAWGADMGKGNDGRGDYWRRPR
jgi:hypothetical protein